MSALGPNKRIAPLAAFLAEVPLTFAPAKEGAKTRPVKMRARSPEPVSDWFWGKIVHDMNGFRTTKPTLPIDYCHDAREVLGFLSEFKATDDGLDVAGELVPFVPTDRASEVLAKGDAGVPYESSIFFDYESIEELAPGMKAEVNGRSLEGPALIVRQWGLRGVAVCPYGRDKNTSTKFAGSLPDEIAVTIFTTPTDAAPMKTDAATTATAPAPAPALSASPATAAPAPQAQPAPAADRAAFTAELKRYTEKFGAENGTKWFTEGKTFEQSLELHAAALSEQLKTKDTELGQLKQKLAAVPRGEAEPVSMSTDEKHPAGSAQPQGKFQYHGNLGKFAATIKLPTAKAS